MGNPNNRKCADCVYFAEDESRCRLTPASQRDPCRITVSPDFWCGEWRGADGATFLESGPNKAWKSLGEKT